MITLCGRYGLVVAGYSGRDEVDHGSPRAPALDLKIPRSRGECSGSLRPESELLPAVSAWLDAAADAGRGGACRWSRRTSMSPTGVVERQLDFPAPLADHRQSVSAQRLASRWSNSRRKSGDPVPRAEDVGVARARDPQQGAANRTLTGRAPPGCFVKVLRESPAGGAQVAIAAIAGGAAAFGAGRGPACRSLLPTDLF